MREDEKIHNKTDNQQNIDKPIVLITVLLVLLVGVFIWFGIKNPKIFNNVRDLVITMFAFLCFLIGTLLAVLFIFLSSNIDKAKIKIDEAMTTADGKVEELADKIVEILKSILQPVVESKSKAAGILHVFSKIKKEEK